MANYQRTPTAYEGALIKRDWWRDGPDHQCPPPVDVNVMAWDTAFSAKTTVDRSAMVVWGTFAQRDNEGNTQQAIILLDAFAARLDFPALKMEVFEMQDLWKPDFLLIENEGTGQPLIQELLRAGIFVQKANPHRESDKHIRTNAVTDLFKSGLIWAPRIAVGGTGARPYRGISARGKR
jgi:phage terminase large subunit-like protein